jgi:hypothetical protein
MRARHRLSKLLVRQGIVYTGGRPWTGIHDDWLRGQRFGQPSRQLAFETAYETMLLTVQRRDRLDQAITAMANDSDYADLVHRLSCLRGISTLTGFGLAVEIGDWHRFSGASIGAFLGLVPTEYSSGQSKSQGSITKTSNGHARRLLVEAAWHHRKTYRNPGQTMRTRWALASPAARARGHEGNRRLHARWQTFTARHKKTVIANVAIAASSPAGPGPSPCSTSPSTDLVARHLIWSQREGRPAKQLWTTARQGRPRPLLDQRKRPSRTARPAVTNPRISA